MFYLCATNYYCWNNCWNNSSLSLQVERCMHSHLKTFASTLKTLDIHSKLTATKLVQLKNYKNFIPKVSLALLYLIAK